MLIARTAKCQSLPVTRNSDRTEIARACRSLEPPLRRLVGQLAEDPGDRPNRRQACVRLAAFELPPDGSRAELAEDALVAERPADVEDQVLEVAVRSPDPEGDRWPIGPRDVVERVISGPAQPQLDGRQPDPELPGNSPLRGARADRLDDRAPFRDGPFAATPLATSPPSSASSISVLTGRLWHLSDREGVASGPSD